ncbi:MAG: DNA-3-methyladenine glycosylase I [Pseudomonadota bacterium]|nr:DNA-3-methyladenine glycosylase I [Pseudomonadota bacterium]
MFNREGFCSWSNSHDIYMEYHDNEWGIPEFNGKKLFEILTLETFQSGLSWIIILKKRDNFRIAFDNFNPKAISRYDDKKLSELMENKSIVRNKKKILSTMNNAKIYNDFFKKPENFSDFFWSYVNHKPIINSRKKLSDIPKDTTLSKKISKKMKELGFTFCGPVTVYSFMQAAGIVNDHLVSCPHYLKCQKD